MIDLIIENFGLLLLLGLGLASWLKSRVEAKQEEEAERKAREEMVRHLQELDERPIQKRPPPVPQKWDPQPSQTQWDTRPQPEPSPSSPPPIKDIFKEVMEAVQPPPVVAAPTKDAYDDEPAPWKEFQHMDASRTEIGEHDDPLESPMLKRQREMQERLAEIKRETAQYKGRAAGARETQRRLERRGKGEIAAMPGIAKVLKDRKQTRRAIVLNEILSKPIGLRGLG